MIKFARMYSSKAALHNALKVNPIKDNFVDTFEIALNESTAKVNYEKCNDGSCDLIITHTHIPEQYQGQGLGHILGQVSEKGSRKFARSDI